MAFFVLMWGTVDFASSTIGLISLRGADTTMSVPQGEAPMPMEKGEQFFDAYYQSKMLQDRLWDSLARVVIAGMIFAYCRIKVERLEKQA